MSYDGNITPQRSKGGLAAMDIFYREYNDFYFYVEDVNQENFYYEILSKIFPRIKFGKIFPLGGKKNVLSHANDESNDSISKRVYILDKDFDDLLGNKEKIHSVFYLERYCIENYLIQQDALVEVVVETAPRLTREVIRRELALDAKIREISDDLILLFTLFFVQKEDLGMSNCSEPPEKFCDNRCLWRISPQILDEYNKKVHSLIEKRKCNRISNFSKEFFHHSDFYFEQRHGLISGKFWLIMIFHYIKSKFGLGSITFDSFLYRLAKNCSFDNLNHLVDEVENTYKFASRKVDEQRYGHSAGPDSAI